MTEVDEDLLVSVVDAYAMSCGVQCDCRACRSLANLLDELAERVQPQKEKQCTSSN